jgi:hypothetical protein
VIFQDLTLYFLSGKPMGTEALLNQMVEALYENKNLKERKE